MDHIYYHILHGSDQGLFLPPLEIRLKIVLLVNKYCSTPSDDQAATKRKKWNTLQSFLFKCQTHHVDFILLSSWFLTVTGASLQYYVQVVLQGAKAIWHPFWRKMALFMNIFISFGLLYLYATIISKCCPVPRLIIWILRQVEAIRYKTIRSFGFFSPEFLIKCLNSLWSTRLRFDGLLVNFWFYRLFWQLFTQTHFYGSLKSRTIII